MFLVVNNRIIQRFQGGRVLIGATPEATVVLPFVQPGIGPCEIENDGAAGWTARNLGVVAISVDGASVPAGSTSLIGSEAIIGLGEDSVQLFFPSTGEAISETLRREQYNLESQIHTAVLDAIQNADLSPKSTQQRDRISKEILSQTRSLELHVEFETYLAGQAIYV